MIKFISDYFIIISSFLIIVVILGLYTKHYHNMRKHYIVINESGNLKKKFIWWKEINIECGDCNVRIEYKNGGFYLEDNRLRSGDVIHRGEEITIKYLEKEAVFPWRMLPSLTIILLFTLFLYYILNYVSITYRM
ncbi:hypothetical protein [Pseudobutyrivibrio xylanivorans]|uniref:DUF3592 domain-containing protein n=1 Tax=Pseudobutyrivibrio xylanivorans DSM 14809 TaxID=1123012 RepID=A0A1M6JF18_PSEXY|nr:hypothetical protein [Pseudobutyrivibrio xylanivorans]SHJ45222.1 hypothetical protein SAMN02745725_02579 [Pseudobutyrivibrio xylanivorans DSM 14809]